MGRGDGCYTIALDARQELAAYTSNPHNTVSAVTQKCKHRRTEMVQSSLSPTSEDFTIPNQQFFFQKLQ